MLKVKDVMTKNVICVDKDMPLVSKQASYFKFQCNRADDFIRTQLSRPGRLAG